MGNVTLNCQLFHFNSNRFVNVYLLALGRIPSLQVQAHTYQEGVLNILRFLKLQNAETLKSLLDFASLFSIIWTEICC